ncbi:MAG: hypothetical protein K1Y36_08945 [Blastocatellia bacterium]|nr:hypothetical protein [Blastocatellia bacterium]
MCVFPPAIVCTWRASATAANKSMPALPSVPVGLRVDVLEIPINLEK